MAKVYKVVREAGNGTFISCRIWGKWELQYRPGKTTVAKVGGVLCFRKLKDARKFARGCDHIWRCYASSTKSIILLPSQYGFLGKFWKGLKVELIEAPPGTVLAPSVTLISKVVR